jgi:transposase
MDRASLEELLSQGLSLAEIGKRFGKHEATVAYWMKKHELAAVNRTKHAAKGGLERGDLEKLVNAGASIAEIAEKVERSKATVRHWLKQYGLQTQAPPGTPSRPGVNQARASGQAEPVLECLRHGSVRHVLDGRGYYRCRQCRIEAVVRRRRRVKETLVRRPVGNAACAATTDVLQPLSFITSIRRARSSGCRGAVRAALPGCDLRRASVCCSAPIAMLRSRRALQSFRKMSMAIVSNG